MSWDVDLVACSGTVDNLLEAFVSNKLSTIGSAQSIRAQVTTIWPTVDWSDPVWGRITRDNCFIEVQLDKGEEITVVTLRIRGGGDPLPEIVALAKALQVQALDRTTMKFLDLHNPSRAGWRSWSKWAKGVDPLGNEQNA